MKTSRSKPNSQSSDRRINRRKRSLLDLMTADEVATALRLTKRAVYRMVERSQIPGVVRLGRRLRFDRVVLSRWLKKLRLRNRKRVSV